LFQNHPKWNEQRIGLRISISDDMGARASKVYTLVGEEEDIVDCWFTCKGAFILLFPL
jgi:hypothetical protein